MEAQNLRVYGSRQDPVIVREMPEALEYLDAVIAGREDEPTILFKKTTKAYVKTTENINGYYNKLFLKDKSVLTVVGSGEQIFEAILRGAKKVDGFDISMNAIMLYYLKEAALKNELTTYATYMNIFYSDSVSNDWLKKAYDIIKRRMNPVAIPFWDKVFATENPKEIIARLTQGGKYPNAPIAGRQMAPLSSHLSEKNFYELKEKIHLCQVNVYLRDVKELDDLEGPYDYIILSNIFQYQTGPLREQFKAAIERYKEKLTENGEIIVGYAYSGSDLSDFKEYDKQVVPSRNAAWGSMIDTKDTIMTTRRK